MKLDEIVKAARFLQIEGAKDFDMNSLMNSSNSGADGHSGQTFKMSAAEGTDEEVSITAYCGEERPEELPVRPFAWLAAQSASLLKKKQQQHHHQEENNTTAPGSVPTSPSSLHSADSLDSIPSAHSGSGTPTIIVNGSTGEFTTVYQQLSPINLKMNLANAAENKQELKRKLLQKKRQLMLISNGGGSSSTAECSQQHHHHQLLKKRACLEAERANSSNGAAAAIAHHHRHHQSSSSPPPANMQTSKLSSDLQVTLQPSGQPVVEPLSLLLNGSRGEGTAALERMGMLGKLQQHDSSSDYYDDLEEVERSHRLKMMMGEDHLMSSKDDAAGVVDCRKAAVDHHFEESFRGDSNNNNNSHHLLHNLHHQQLQHQKGHEVKDNVVIVNQNSSKCLMLKIKSGKIYKDDPPLPEIQNGT